MFGDHVGEWKSQDQVQIRSLEPRGAMWQVLDIDWRSEATWVLIEECQES